RMLRRRSTKSSYSPEQTIRWLSYLAAQMKQQSQTVFYVERMQPDWLVKKWQRRLYSGLIAGPISSLLVGLAFLYTLPSYLPTVLLTALTIGLLFAWLSEPGTEKTGAITNLWRQSFSAILGKREMVGVVTGLAAGISTALYSFVIDYPQGMFGSRIAFALTYGVLNGMNVGLSLG